MQRKWQSVALGVALTTALVISSAFAAQNVANTSQKGSLLIFPDINVSEGFATVIRIANDGNSAIDVKCYYVNQHKARADFEFKLTKKQPMVWDAASGTGDPNDVTPFPATAGPFPVGGDIGKYVGELICFAVNPAGSHQVSWNHLSGTATVYDLAGANSAYEYSSWNFTARGVPAKRTVGTAGRLDLTGADKSYDACPTYNIAQFTPYGWAGQVNGVDVQAVDTDIAVSTCLQDLRQDFTPHWTKIEIPVWNAQEVKFTGAYECANSTHHFSLTGIDVLASNTSFETLGTQAAQLQLRGVKSNQCSPFIPILPGTFTEATGLVAVQASFIRPGMRTAVTTNHAGMSAIPGFVLWDHADSEVPEKR